MSTSGNDAMTDASHAQAFDEDEADFTPPFIDAPADHPMWREVREKLRTVHDPEIPVNIYELGLVYRVEIGEGNAVKVDMTLTSPGCPVAETMPGMVREAVQQVEGVGDVDVEIVWDPMWNPRMMAETAKMALDMGY
jgi:FeS assembly SUF system protein